jgi:hypothetical protein
MKWAILQMIATLGMSDPNMSISKQRFDDLSACMEAMTQVSTLPANPDVTPREHIESLVVVGFICAREDHLPTR